MINLRVDATFNWSGAPKIFTMRSAEADCIDLTRDAVIEELVHGGFLCKCGDGEFTFTPPQRDDFAGDIVLCMPSAGKIERLFRANSSFNTLTITERCDQLCLMCSQPPRQIDDSWRFPLYAEAISRLPESSWITLSGGEPTIYGNSFVELLEMIAAKRPDLNIHILSNAQHLDSTYVPRLREVHNRVNILWGIPLYASDGHTHDTIVDKDGAFQTLMPNLYALASAGACIELRTVVTALNVLELPKLAKFIHRHLPFVGYWAVMAMEPVGFAKANIDRLWFDHSVARFPVHAALDIAKLCGMEVKLFNFPRCTIGPRYRSYCTQSISDWKRKYLKVCDECEEKRECTGFFEWYKGGWERVQPIIQQLDTGVQSEEAIT